MTGSFLDTTIVVNVADRGDVATKAFLEANPPVAVASYALRELLVGHLQILCDVHNRIRAAASIDEVLASLVAMNPVVGRKKQGALQAFAVAFSNRVSQNANKSVMQVGKEMTEDLALRITRSWIRAKRLTAQVQPLGCFAPGDLAIKAGTGEIRGPNGSFNCHANARCSAAEYVYGNDVALSNLIAALHPDALAPELAKKNETAQRRKALKELRDKGPERFSKARCRAIGDAYFAAMCPAGHRVVTTNASDFVPLCKAVGCPLVVP